MGCCCSPRGGWCGARIWTMPTRRRPIRRRSRCAASSRPSALRDLAFVGFLVALLGLGFKRPFLFVLAYAYVDIVAPQHLSYFLLNSIPLSLIVTLMAMAGWLIADEKKGFSIAPRQWLMLAILGWAAFTTLHADMPKYAPDKWEWVWKAVLWSIFLPFTLRTRLRIEAYLLFMTLSAGGVVLVGGGQKGGPGGGGGGRTP